MAVTSRIFEYELFRNNEKTKMLPQAKIFTNENFSSWLNTYNQNKIEHFTPSWLLTICIFNQVWCFRIQENVAHGAFHFIHVIWMHLHRHETKSSCSTHVWLKSHENNKRRRMSTFWFLKRERKHDNNDAERSNWSVKDKGQLQLRGVRAFIKRPTARKQS